MNKRQKNGSYKKCIGLQLKKKTRMSVKFWDGHVGPQIKVAAGDSGGCWVSTHLITYLCSTPTGLLGSSKLSFEAISILNNWLLLCCFAELNIELETNSLFFFASKFNFMK